MTSKNDSGWSRTSTSYQRRIARDVRGVVGILDGAAWGYLIVDADGVIQDGQLSDEWDAWDAIRYADAALLAFRMAPP